MQVNQQDTFKVSWSKTLLNMLWESTTPKESTFGEFIINEVKKEKYTHPLQPQ